MMVMMQTCRASQNFHATTTTKHPKKPNMLNVLAETKKKEKERKNIYKKNPEETENAHVGNHVPVKHHRVGRLCAC